MIQSFGDSRTSDVYHGKRSKKAVQLATLLPVIERKLDMLNAAHTLDDLKSPPSNRLEKLKGGRIGFYSIRVNIQYRIVFRFETGNAYDVAIVDYH